jgi:hypothetical protein
MLKKYIRSYLLLFMVWLIPYHESNIWAQKSVQIYDVKYVTVSKNHPTEQKNYENKIFMQRNLFFYSLDTLFVIYDTITDIKFEIDEGLFFPGHRLMYKKAISVYDVKRKLLYDLVNSSCFRFNFKDIPVILTHPIAHQRKEITVKGYSDVKMYFKKSNQSTYYPFFYELFPNYLLERLESNKITLQLKSFLKTNFYLSQQQIQEIHQKIQNITCDSLRLITFENYILGVE